MVNQKYNVVFFAGHGRPHDVKVDIINAAAIQVSWEGGDGNHTGYKLSCIARSNHDACKTVSVEGCQMKHAVVAGLHPGMRYKVNVRSVSNEVESPGEPPGGISVTLRK